MRKLIIVIAICLLCLIFASCEPIHFRYNYEEFNDNIISVEMINYDNPKSKIVQDHIGTAKHSNFDFTKMENIETMKEEYYDDFFADISDKLMLNHVNHHNSPNGMCIKINYTGGDFDIMSIKNEYIGRFDNEGNFKEFLGIFDGGINSDLVGHYFETRIE